MLQLIITKINKRRIMEIILIYSIILSINTLEIENISKGIGLYNGLYIEEMTSKIIEIVIYIISILTIKYISKGGGKILIITIIIVGMITIINSNDLIGLLLGIEIETLGIYIIIGKESKRKNSIGIKYFLLGAITSSIIYLGISIIYSIIGVTSLEDILIIKEIGGISIPLYLIIYGLIFKLGGVPLHNYLSDIIEGLRLNISIWILGISKITILIIINKLNIYNKVSEILIIVIQLSLILGALVGTIQKRIKRLITYSSINNIGYLLTGVLINTNIIKIGFILYIIQYILTTVNIIIIILSVCNTPAVSVEEIKELRIIKNNSVRLLMLITLLSLIGIPPLLGFYGKLYIMIPILEYKNNMIIILIILSNIISSYYYIKLIKIIYGFTTEDRREIRLGALDNRLGIITTGIILIPTEEIFNILLIIK